MTFNVSLTNFTTAAFCAGDTRQHNTARHFLQSNKNFQNLTKLNILQLYENEIFPRRIDDIKSQITVISKINYRNDRKARESYKKLLGELEIDADTADLVKSLGFKIPVQTVSISAQRGPRRFAKRN